MLKIRLLGTYEVKMDDQPVEISSRPARLLFAYLVLTAGVFHPREKLAGLLWPDSDESNARSNLRQALWRLRKAVGDAYFATDNKRVAFEANSNYWLDAALLASGSESDLVEAVSAYHGDLLPGYYEDWVLLEREKLQAALERKIQMLLDQLVDQEQWPQVLKWSEYWIAFGQVPEPAYRALMVAHAAQGNLAAVAAAYERCTTALQLEVGVEPSAETQALYERLLREGHTKSRRPQLKEETEDRNLRNNLPHHTTPLIGRENELVEIGRLLKGTRLLSLLGPGGIGKTRLAVQAATEMVGDFRHGVYLVALAPLDSARYIVQAIAEAIGFPLSTGEDPQQQLLRHLRNRRYLLLLDNFEHILEGAVLVGEILRETEGVHILITSRERLNLQEETTLIIEGLSVPETSHEANMLAYGAVLLFIEGARRIRPDFEPGPSDWPAISRICHMVEGLPLAILMASAWVDMLATEEIAGEISRSLDFLRAEWQDAPGRHRSLRAAFDSSWRRLTDSQQAIFAKLAIFKGGFTREAAAEVAGASLADLASLVHKSLLRRDLANGRYEIHELIRQYAQEELEVKPGAIRAVSEAHAAYFADFIEARWEPLGDGRQRVALAEIEADLENARAAWRYWLQRRNPARIRMFMYVFWRVYDIRGWYNAGQVIFAEAADAFYVPPDKEASQEIRVVYAMARTHQASFMAQLGYTEKGLALAEESVSILQYYGRSDALIMARVKLTWNASYVMAQEAAWEMSRDEELETADLDPWIQAYALCWQGRFSALVGDIELGMRLVEESLHFFEARGDFYATVWPGFELSNMSVMLGDYNNARVQYKHVLKGAEDHNYDWARAKVLRYLGSLAIIEKEYQSARSYLLEALGIADELGMLRDLISTLYDIATVVAEIGDPLKAVRLLSFIRRHPLSDQARTFSLWSDKIRPAGVVRIRMLATNLLEELESGLPHEDYAAAEAAGKKDALDDLVLKQLAD